MARFKDRLRALPARGREMHFDSIDVHDWYEEEIRAALDALAEELRAADARFKGGPVATSGGYS